MRIAILTQYFPPEIGAPQARLSELVRELVEAGHETFVLTAMPSYPIGRVYDGYSGLVSREVKDGAAVLRTWAYPNQSPAMARRLLNYCSFALMSLLVGLFRLPRVDYLICESPPVFLGATAWLLSRLKGARWVFNVSDLWTDTAVRVGVLTGGWKLRLAARLEKWCYQQAWCVSGQSREITSIIETRHPGVSTYHLSNGVNTKMFTPALRCERFRRDVGFHPYCVVLYSGLHGLAQGLMQVLHAARLLQNEEGLKFVLIGDGPEKRQLVEEARRMKLSNIEFRDPISREKMPLLVAAADIGIVPLKTHIPGAVPSKLYEMMGCGVPVVLAASGEPAGIVTEASCGLTVPCDDPPAMADAIRLLLRDVGTRTRMGQAGRYAAERHYNRHIISKRFIEFLERHMNGAAHSGSTYEKS